MVSTDKLYALAARTELSTRRCDLSCSYCTQCQKSEIPAANLERVLAAEPPPDPRVYRISGGDPFRYGELERWVAYGRRNERSLVCVEGPAATFGGPHAEAAVAKVLAVKPDVVALVLPTVDPARTERFTGVAWEPSRVFDALRRLRAAGIGVEIVFPANELTAASLPEVVETVATELGAVDVTLRRMPVVRRDAVSLPLVGGAADWPELDALSRAIARLPTPLPHGARLHMDRSAGYAPCMLGPDARRRELVNLLKAQQKPIMALGEACAACAWSTSCSWQAHHGGKKPPADQVNPLTRDEALALQEQSGAAATTHLPRTFRTDRAALGLPDLLCAAPWTTLSSTDPQLHPVPCALSWVDTTLAAADIAAETGESVAGTNEKLRHAATAWNGYWHVLDNDELSLMDLWNSPLLRRMRRQMTAGGASQHCRKMCRVVMGVEERGLWGFARPDSELPPSVAANRRLLLEEINAGKNVLTAKPLDLMMGVSAHCNISCGFCDGPLGAYGDISERRVEEIKTFLPSLMSMGASGPGEPLMGRNFLALLGYIADTGFPGLGVSLTTNGTLLTPAFLERHRNVPWSHVRISINAGSAETHERMTGKKLFDRVRENLDALCALRDQRRTFQITLSCVLGSVQMGGLHGFAKLVDDYRTNLIVEPMYGNLRNLSPWVKPDRLVLLADELQSVADAYTLRNPPLSRAFRAVEEFARRRLAGTDFTPLEHH